MFVCVHVCEVCIIVYIKFLDDLMVCACVCVCAHTLGKEMGEKKRAHESKQSRFFFFLFF